MRSIVWGSAAVGFCLLGFMVWQLNPAPPTEHVAEAAALPSVSPAVESPRGPPPPADETATGAPKGLARAKSAERKRADAIREKLRQARLAKAVAEAHAEAAAQDSKPASEGAEGFARMPSGQKKGDGPTPVKREYIQRMLREQFIPLAKECYEELLDRDPQAAGRLKLDFSITGDSSVGGVVDEVELGDGTTFEDEEIRLCLRESMYSVVFDAPPEDGQVITIGYPIEFAP